MPALASRDAFMAAPALPRHVLVVEDNPMDVSLVRRMLQTGAMGGPLQITDVPRLAEALHQLRTLRFDAILLDLNLLDAQGVASIIWLNNAVQGETPIIVYSNAFPSGMQEQIELCGARVCLDKQHTSPATLRHALWESFAAPPVSLHAPTTMPAHAASAIPLAQPSRLAYAASQPRSVMDPRQLNILLVEDNAGDGLLTERAVEDAGLDARVHTLTRGSNVVPFLEECERAGQLPDLLLLDLGLPDMDGGDVLHELSAAPASLRAIPIAILTGYANFEYIQKNYTLCIVAHLTKPCRAEQLMSLLARLRQPPGQMS